MVHSLSPHRFTTFRSLIFLEFFEEFWKQKQEEKNSRLLGFVFKTFCVTDSTRDSEKFLKLKISCIL